MARHLYPPHALFSPVKAKQWNALGSLGSPAQVRPSKGKNGTPGLLTPPQTLTSFPHNSLGSRSKERYPAKVEPALGAKPTQPPPKLLEAQGTAAAVFATDLPC